MNLAFLKIFEGLFSQASKIVDETITTKEEKLEKRNELEQIFNDGKTKAVELALKEQEIQASTIKKEMEGSSLQRNWRPLTALIFVFIVFCNFFLLKRTHSIKSFFLLSCAIRAILFCLFMCILFFNS